MIIVPSQAAHKDHIPPGTLVAIFEAEMIKMCEACEERLISSPHGVTDAQCIRRQK